MAGLQDDIARVWAWFRIQPKPARLALAGALAGAVALIYAYNAWPVLLVVVFLLISRYGKKRDAPGRDLPTDKRARHRAVRAAHRKALPASGLAIAPIAKASNEPTAAEIQRAAADAGRGVMRALNARRDQRGPPPRGEREAAPVAKRDQGSRPLSVHPARPIVEDGGSLWRRRGSSSRGSIVE